jgi:MoaA/NifB/PqqE/SkfB family radical SAM enzyme
MELAKRLKTERFAEHFREGSIDFASSIAEQVFLHPSLRGPVLRELERSVVARANGKACPGCPDRVLQDQADMLSAIFASAARALDRGQISRKALRGLLRTFLANVVLAKDRGIEHAKQRFAEKHGGALPPSFLVISPTSACNLRCAGCYSSSGSSPQRLEWETLDRIVTEAKELWGVRFFTISGGEPLMYRSNGKRLLDLVERHHDCFFQSYTNGCFIDRPTAERMADAGNLVPAISVEGLEPRTDARRGAGVFKRILQAMDNLRTAGVPFGISMTATRQNAEEVLSDELVDFFFEKQQAVFGWLFQYMPIGRGYTADLVVTPQQRLGMWERTWRIIRERKIMLADFWNCGTVTQGCIAAGTSYLYIDWNGKVMPCVFVPYSPANIRDIYRRGGTLDDVYDLPYFQAIRRWQSDYARSDGPEGRGGNWLLPCSLRDHYATGRELIGKYRPVPEDRSAAEALIDQEYAGRMRAYDKDLKQVFDPVWEQEYLKAETRRSGRPGDASNYWEGEDEDPANHDSDRTVESMIGSDPGLAPVLGCQENLLTCRDDEGRHPHR